MLLRSVSLPREPQNSLRNSSDGESQLASLFIIDDLQLENKSSARDPLHCPALLPFSQLHYFKYVTTDSLRPMT